MATHAVIGLLMLGLRAWRRDSANLPWELVDAGDRRGGAGACRRGVRVHAPARIPGRPGAGAGRGAHDRRARARRATALFFNGRFLERLVGAGLLVIAALEARRLRHRLDSLMLTVAIGWAAFALGARSGAARPGVRLAAGALGIRWPAAAVYSVRCALSRRRDVWWSAGLRDGI